MNNKIKFDPDDDCNLAIKCIIVSVALPCIVIALVPVMGIMLGSLTMAHCSGWWNGLSNTRKTQVKVGLVGISAALVPLVTVLVVVAAFIDETPLRGYIRRLSSGEA